MSLNTADFTRDATSGDLHQCAMRTAAQSDPQRCAHNSFFADDCHLDAPAIAGEYDQRGHTVVQEVREFKLCAGLVENVLLGQIQSLQMSTK